MPLPPKKKTFAKPAPKTTKAKPKTKEEVKEVTKAQFLAKYKNKTAIVKQAGKETAPSGFADASELMERLNIRVGSSKTVKAKVSVVKIKEINGVDVADFKFVLLDPAARGLSCSSSIWIQDDEVREKTEDDAFKEIVFQFQKMGYDTSDLDIGSLYEACEQATADKPAVLLRISIYKVKTGKTKGTVKSGISISRPYDEEEDGEDEEAPEEEEVESEEEDSEEEETEEPETEEESEEEESEFKEDDPSTWVGYGIKAKPAGTKKAAEYEITDYARNFKKLTIKGSDGKSYKITPNEVIDWVQE